MAAVKFEGVDVLDFLGQVVELHTQHYKDDFNIDRELIQNLAACKNGENEQLLWMSRTCGTYCLWERDVYLQDSHENKVWRFYHEQTKDSILAYAIRLDGIQDGKATGCIWPLDYHAHVERVKLLVDIVHPAYPHYIPRQLFKIHRPLYFHDRLAVCGLHADLQLDQPRPHLGEKGQFFLPQKFGRYLKMKICDTIVMFFDILPYFHCMIMIAIKSSVN